MKHHDYSVTSSEKTRFQTSLSLVSPQPFLVSSRNAPLAAAAGETTLSYDNLYAKRHAKRGKRSDAFKKVRELF